MKAILEFDLPEDREEWEMARRSEDIYLALWDTFTYLRGQYKHSDPEMFPADDIDKIYARFREILTDHSVGDLF